MSIDDSFFSYFTHASMVVQGIMLFLIALSMVSWSIILQRRFFFKRLLATLEKFEYRFWSGIDLQKLFQELDGKVLTGLPSVFYAGFREYVRLTKQCQVDSQELLTAVERAMRIACAKEATLLENHLNILATVGSTTPYIGLFGTVWGIMTSFHALGHSAGQATIAMVAPGISEALVATAMGLFAAIPAVIAYNRYQHHVQCFQDRFEIFQEEFIAILFRKLKAHA